MTYQHAGGPGRGVPLASLVAVALAAGLAGAAFHRGFPASDLFPPLVVAAVVPVVVTALVVFLPPLRALRRGAGSSAGPPRPRPVSVSVGVSALVWLAVVRFTLFRNGSPQAEGALPAVWDGVVNGGARLLETTLPVLGSPDLLVVPQALTWLAALAGAELVARTRAPLVPALPAIAVFVAGVLLTVPGAGSNLGVAAGLVAAVLVLVMCRRAELTGTAEITGTVATGASTGAGTGSDAGGFGAGRGRRRGRMRVTAVVPAVAVLVVTAGIAPLAGPLLAAAGPGDGERYDVRDLRQVTLDQQTAQSPLDHVSAWLGHPDDVLFRVSPPVAGNIRLAVLDRFDGQRWTSSARYLPAGGRVPPETAADGARMPSGDAPSVTSQLQIVALDGPFLPHLDRPAALSGSGLAVDVRDGTLTATEGHTGGGTEGDTDPDDRRYTVVSVAPREPTPAELASAQVPTGAAVNETLALPPGLPKVVRDAARAAAGGALTPFQQARQLEQYLRTLVYDPSAPAGHTYGHLAYFLGTSRAGTSEQFAAAYAVFARVVGLPSRVVVGFSPKPDRAGGDAATGDVRAGDVLVWPEIRFEGLGWVPFYPTPAAAADNGGQVATTAQGEPSERAQRVAEAAAVPAPPTVPNEVPPARTDSDRSVVVLAGLGAAALLVIAAVGYLAAAAAAPRLRRRRRARAARARERIVGAWQDTLDALDVAGVPVPASATSAEIVTMAGAGVRVGAGVETGSAVRTGLTAPAGSVAAMGSVAGMGSEAQTGSAAIADLAVLVTAALFAGGEVREADADAAWRHADRVRAELRASTSRTGRVRRSLAPGRLAHRRSELSRPPGSSHRSNAAQSGERGTGR
ncbi:transglutaminase domain-containing protein [Parafrankia sp. EUN1f]|uniref:DUF3488 and transglutaminase-like domain-containing protein n=1 Tax=Parafrankia sp. EUN1f TaxID=102897 RepID=UPI0001C470DD|nr:transglutaminase domain-containing protein [Parafrankia sp. EUN1f]EFC80022.1 transglutaminase domain protein [Parafrankia sp. EUN1f]